jgi:acyl carrier protein
MRLFQEMSARAAHAFSGHTVAGLPRGEFLSMNPASQEIKEYILGEFLPGEDPSQLTETTPLITGGILDSLATIRLVAWLEKTYSIELSPHETGIDYLNTIEDIVQLVESKRS